MLIQDHPDHVESAHSFLKIAFNLIAMLANIAKFGTLLIVCSNDVIVIRDVCRITSVQDRVPRDCDLAKVIISRGTDLTKSMTLTTSRLDHHY